MNIGISKEGEEFIVVCNDYEFGKIGIREFLKQYFDKVYKKLSPYEENTLLVYYAFYERYNETDGLLSGTVFEPREGEDEITYIRRIKETLFVLEYGGDMFDFDTLVIDVKPAYYEVMEEIRSRLESHL